MLGFWVSDVESSVSGNKSEWTRLWEREAFNEWNLLIVGGLPFPAGGMYCYVTEKQGRIYQRMQVVRRMKNYADDIC